MQAMRGELPDLDLKIDTIAELRELYRAAEARAARLRLLSSSGQELAQADASTIDAVLARCAERLAFFTGHRSAAIARGNRGGEGIAIVAPGPDRACVGRIAIAGLPAVEAIEDLEDREAFRMHLELMGSTIDRIERDEERAGLLARLREREQRLAQLVGRMFSAQEDERRRVSQDLHDGVAQTATALARLLEGAGGAGTRALPAGERARLAAIARDLVTELRAVIGGLRPTLLDDLGLEAALQALAEGLESDGFAVVFRVEGETARLPAHVETALFRVAQEAVSNIRKHAGGPCDVMIELTLPEDGRPGFLRIADHGTGAAGCAPAGPGASGPGHHVGIDVMRERMTAIGGALEWSAGVEGGVTLTARLGETP